MQNKIQDLYTYTIVGAGASGLWLAYSLFKNKLLENNTLCIVENDTKKTNDRTWCYWSEEPISPLDINSKTWDFILNTRFPNHSEKLLPYKYYHVRSNDFYLRIKLELSSCKNVSWKFDEVTEVNELADSVQIKTTQGSWNSERTFLSTPLTKKEPNYKIKDDLWIWQSFYGWRVKTSAPIFNDMQMSMMNFNVYQGNNTQFIYELPFSKTEALVEMTRFGVEIISKNEAEIELQKWMNSKNVNFEILEFEFGIIPMTTAFDKQPKYFAESQRIIYIGTPAGAIKPTSGYGFKRMQQYGHDLSVALKNKSKLPSMRRKSRFRLYDILLLQILINKPEKGKQIFEELFKHQPIKRILKFLDEETNILEEIRIFSKLPINLFLNSLFSYLVKK